MKLTPTRPVTIDGVRHGERWFPRLHRHTDGSLLLYTEYGHDRNFSPDFRLRSTDNGKTFSQPTDLVPRAICAYSFPDGELLEMDAYGVHDPHTKDVAGYFAAWSNPGDPLKPVRKEIVRVHTPSGKMTPLRELSGQGYPTFHWWPLWNTLHNNPELKGDEIHLNGPYFGSGLVLEDGRVLALCYGYHRDFKKCHLWLFETRDRGRNWEEMSLVARDESTPEGPDEATLVQLKDGRLYVVARTGGELIHTWSSDLGKTWTPHEKLRLSDTGETVHGVWPIIEKLADGTLLMTYGRPGKNIVFDPTGTGTKWQGRLDLHAWEYETQTIMGVPEAKRINNKLDPGIRYWNSGDYLFCVADGPRAALVGYDVQHFTENWNAEPISGIRMLRVTLED